MDSVACVGKAAMPAVDALEDAELTHARSTARVLSTIAALKTQSSEALASLTACIAALAESSGAAAKPLAAVHKVMKYKPVEPALLRSSLHSSSYHGRSEMRTPEDASQLSCHKRLQLIQAALPVWFQGPAELATELQYWIQNTGRVRSLCFLSWSWMSGPMRPCHA